MAANRLRFGVFLPQIAMRFEQVLEKALAAEAHGFDALWLMDHLWTPGATEADCLEGWTLATALAVRTGRLRLGHMVLCNAFRHPALLAKMSATLDHISGGRLELGLGWGSVPDELTAFGIGDEPPAVRAARLGEAIEVLRLLWSGERVSHSGRFYQLREAIARPRPLQARIPLHIGGAGRTLTLPLVARHADWWNCVSTGVARLAELRPLAGSARVSVQHAVALAPSEEELPALRARAERRFAGWGGALVGTAPQLARALALEARSGVEGFVLAFHDGAAPATLERFARDVIPAVRAALA